MFPYFSAERERWLTDAPRDGYSKICVGLDFGGTGSLNTMCAVGFVNGYERMVVLAESALPRGERIDTEGIAAACADFCAGVRERFGRYDHVFGDAADPALINRVAAILRGRGLPWRCVGECVKTPLESRPVSVDGLLCADRIRIDRRCTGLITALSQLRWDADKPSIPEDKNLGNINDYWDSFSYAWSAWTDYFDRRAR